MEITGISAIVALVSIVAIVMLSTKNQQSSGNEVSHNRGKSIGLITAILGLVGAILLFLIRVEDLRTFIEEKRKPTTTAGESIMTRDTATIDRSNPENYYALYKSSIDHFNNKEFDKGLVDANDAIRLKPAYARIQINAEKFADYAPYYAKAINLFGLGVVRGNNAINYFEEAYEAIHEAIIQRPEANNAYNFYVALFCFYLNDHYKEAQDNIAEAIRLENLFGGQFLELYEDLQAAINNNWGNPLWLPPEYRDLQ